MKNSKKGNSNINAILDKMDDERARVILQKLWQMIMV